METVHMMKAAAKNNSNNEFSCNHFNYHVDCKLHAKNLYKKFFGETQNGKMRNKKTNFFNCLRSPF